MVVLAGEIQEITKAIADKISSKAGMSLVKN
jgi:hypothetical protein